MEFTTDNDDNWQDRQRQDQDAQKQAILDDLAYLHLVLRSEGTYVAEKLERLAYGLGLGLEFKQMKESQDG